MKFLRSDRKIGYLDRKAVGCQQEFRRYRALPQGLMEVRNGFYRRCRRLKMTIRDDAMQSVGVQVQCHGPSAVIGQRKHDQIQVDWKHD